MINIAIDGPSGSGKSTIAKFLSERLNILYLDTGAMYRATALKAKKLGVDCKDEKAVSKFIENIDLKISYIDGAQHTFLDGEDVSDKIRINEISMMASNISALPCVRKKMVELQREIAEDNDCVLDGRDIGSYVLPNARFKFYITAKPEIRAERRYKELLAKGQNIDYGVLLEEIKKRDFNDSHREIAPLKKVKDAVEIDTSYLTVEEVALKVLSSIVR